MKTLPAVAHTVTTAKVEEEEEEAEEEGGGGGSPAATQPRKDAATDIRSSPVQVPPSKAAQLSIHAIRESPVPMRSSSPSPPATAAFGSRPSSPLGPLARDPSAGHAEAKKIRGDSFQSRCVYNYEDRYRFSRILSSTTLVFDSHFESGNLLRASRILYNDARDNNVRLQEYDLELHHDLHSMGHNQWFYFSVSNTMKGCKVKFNITNFGKPDSLYNHGLKPLLFSQRAATDGVGWRRTGTEIMYYCNRSSAPAQKDRPSGSKMYYTATFTHIFEHGQDVCFFAMCYPYTYSDLRHYLYNLQLDPKRCKNFRREVLCETLAGNHCDMLTITSMPCKSPVALSKRLGVVLTARVHPGESNSSFIMHGIIDYLTSDTPEAEALRKKFVFKVVPMLNPDGVINGNYRTSLAGVDLNRRWDKPDADLHPTIDAVKKMVRRFQSCRQIILQTDIHGHSRKEGLFVYGCVPDRTWFRYIAEKEEARAAKIREEEEKRREGVDAMKKEKKVLAFGAIHKVEAGSTPSEEKKDGSVANLVAPPVNPIVTEPHGMQARLDEKLRARMFPRIFHSNCDAFRFDKCSFKLQKSKATTMRIVMYEEFGIVCSYTLEASFSGVDGRHFSMDELKEMGRDFCVSMTGFAEYLEIENQSLSNLTHRTRMAAQTSNADFPEESTQNLDDSIDAFDESSVAEQSQSQMRPSEHLLNDQYGFPVGDVDEEDTAVELPPGSPLNKPLNDLLMEEMRILKKGDLVADDGGYESAGSDSDPSGDNLTENELKEKLAGNKKKKKKKGVGRNKKKSADKVRSRSATEPSNGNKKDKPPLLTLPTRPKGSSRGGVRRQVSLQSKTPRAGKAVEDGTMGVEEKGFSSRYRARAQSASAIDRRFRGDAIISKGSHFPDSFGKSSCNDSNSTDKNVQHHGPTDDPRFVMEGDVHIKRRTGLGQRQRGSSFRERRSFDNASGAQVGIAMRKEAEKVRNDVQKNLDLKIGSLGGK